MSRSASNLHSRRSDSVRIGEPARGMPQPSGFPSERTPDESGTDFAAYLRGDPMLTLRPEQASSMTVATLSPGSLLALSARPSLSTATTGNEAHTPRARPMRSTAGQPDDGRMQGWIEAIARRDEKALGSLYDATVARVHGLALRLLRDPQAAEEVTVDTYWQAWRQATRFDPSRGNALAWLLTIARSRALDAIRARDPALHGALGDAELQLDQRIDQQAADPADLLCAAGERDRLHTALDTLDPMSRQMVALAFFRGLSHEEIATHLALPLGTVKSRIRRALVRLRETMPEDQDRSSR